MLKQITAKLTHQVQLDQIPFDKRTPQQGGELLVTDITADSGSGSTGISAELATYAPVPVPEPSMLLVLPVMAAAMGLRRRRSSNGMMRCN